MRQRDKNNPWPPKNTEVAIAVVDEGLLELMPNRSWKLLDAMMGRRGYEVHTSTAQMQVVGKRHYGLKAFPAGGGGGRSVTREMFDTLLLWKGRVTLNDNGEADDRDPAERLAHELQDRRSGERRYRALRERRDLDPDDAGSDAPVRPAAGAAGRRPVSGSVHDPERIGPEDGCRIFRQTQASFDQS